MSTASPITKTVGSNLTISDHLKLVWESASNIPDQKAAKKIPGKQTESSFGLQMR